MTPEVQQNKILDPNSVVIFKVDEIERRGLELNYVLNCWDRGILLDADIYIIKKKDDAIKKLIDKTL